MHLRARAVLCRSGLLVACCNPAMELPMSRSCWLLQHTQALGHQDQGKVQDLPAASPACQLMFLKDFAQVLVTLTCKRCHSVNATCALQPAQCSLKSSNTVGFW